MTRWIGSLVLLVTIGVHAQGSAPSNALVSSPATVIAVLRERTNATQWFAATPHAEQYGHQDSLLRLSLAQRIRRFDYVLELGQSAEIALPLDAVSPVAAQGQLGLGGTYYAANDNNQDPAAVSFRQGFLRYHFQRDSRALRMGRFEFVEGQETTPKNKTLLWLQTNRVAQRLVGNFGFSNGQRSFDGIEGKMGGTNWDVTAMAGRPIQGVFNMNANPELNVDIQYLAYTRYVAKQRVLLRGFGLAYHDGRTGLTKTDNRPLQVRLTDRANIRMATYGGDMIAALPVHRETLDLVVWGAGQSGSWGLLEQSSGAVAVECGLKLDTVISTPWLRGGFLRTTGDANNTDGKHNTFFQVLPTPRVYARFPYFNMMNLEDEFVQLIDRPRAKLDLRSDLHFLQLTSPADFWYQGGGAFDNKVFGYVGRPGNSHGSFSSLADVSADYAFSKQVSLGLYYAHSFGKTVVAATYPTQRDANFGFFELTYRFERPLGAVWKP